MHHSKTSKEKGDNEGCAPFVLVKHMLCRLFTLVMRLEKVKMGVPPALRAIINIMKINVVFEHLKTHSLTQE